MDVQVYVDAVNQFANSIVEYFKGLPVDEDYAWGAIGLGFILLVIGIILL